MQAPAHIAADASAFHAPPPAGAGRDGSAGVSPASSRLPHVPPSPAGAGRGAWLLAALFFVVLAACGIERVRRGGVGVSDLAIFHTALLNTWGERFYFTWLHPEGCLFYQHFDPIALLLLPFYGLWGNAAWPVLPLSMALAVALVVPGVAAIARAEGLSPRPTLALAALLLVQPALHNAAWYDFHPVVVALPLLIWGWHWLRGGRWWAGAVAWGAALLCKENVALTVAALGIALWLMAPLWGEQRRPAQALQRRAGLLALAAGLCWFVLVTRVIIPHFRELGTGNIYLERYAWLGATPVEIVRRLLLAPHAVLGTVFTRPSSWGLLAGLLLPLGLLPLAAPRLWPALLPELAVLLLSSFDATHTIRFHYQAVLMAPLLIATACGLAALLGPHPPRPLRWRRGVACAAAAVALVGAPALLWREGRTLPFLPRPHRLDYYDRERRGDEIAAVRALIPRAATLSLPLNLLNPIHGFTERPLVAFLPDRAQQADYVLLDLRTGYFGGHKEAGLDVLAAQLAASPVHERIYGDRGLLLYRRRVQSSGTPAQRREDWRRGSYFNAP